MVQRNERGELEYLTGPAPYRRKFQTLRSLCGGVVRAGSHEAVRRPTRRTELLDPQRFRNNSDRAAR